MMTVQTRGRTITIEIILYQQNYHDQYCDQLNTNLLLSVFTAAYFVTQNNQPLKLYTAVQFSEANYARTE